jgi:hypothetical protein
LARESQVGRSIADARDVRRTSLPMLELLAAIPADTLALGTMLGFLLGMIAADAR